MIAEGDEAAHLDQIALNASVANANTGAAVNLVSPTSGLIKRLLVGLSADTTNDCTYTLAINGTNVTGGVATIEAAAQDKRSGVATPTALNAVAAGDAISVTYTADGTAGSTAAVSVLIER